MLQRQLRWLGHVIRMPSNRLPRRLLYGELLLGRRPVGVTLITWSQWSGSVTFLYLISSNWQRTGNCGVWRAPWVWRISQQHLNKQLVIVADMPQLRQRQLALSALTVAEPVLRTSVSAVIFVSTYDRTTTTSVQRHRRNRRTTSSKQATYCAQAYMWCCFRRYC